MIFDDSERVRDLTARVETFIDDVIIPAEKETDAEGELLPETLTALRAQAPPTDGNS